MPLTVVAENCGTSVRLIETTDTKVLADKRRDFISADAPTLPTVASDAMSRRVLTPHDAAAVARSVTACELR